MGQTTSEYRKQVTERLIGMLESGTAPWQKPWDAGIAAMNRPHNFNGRPYHGVNALMLWCTAIDKGYEDPRWLTFNQVKKLGGHVNKGEKSQLVEYWQWEKEVENPETGEKEKVPLPHPKVFRAMVFNADQCSGLPPLERPVQKWTPHERADRIVAANGVQVMHSSGEGAFYSPGGDYICLPPKESFATEDAYYSTLLHEVGHSTGHPARLNREFSGRFGSENYAKEELRAELASTFLCGELGIATTGSDEQHAAYVKSWVSALQNDYNEIFRAAADAEKICNYLYEREKEYLQLKEQGIEPQVKQLAAESINDEQVLMRMTPEERRSKENTLPQDIVTVQLAETIPLRGKDVFIINDKIYIGDREYYGNNGLYDNSDNTLEYVSSNPHLLHFVSGREFAYSAESMLKREELDRADFEEYKALKETGVLAKYENIRVGDVSFEGKPFDEVYVNMAFIENVPTYDFPFVLVQNARERDAGIIDEIENGEHYGVSPLRFVKYLDIDGSDPISSMNEVLLKAKERLNESDEKLNMPATFRQRELLDYFGVAYKTDITCNNAENLLKNAHITREQIDYAHKKGFYDDMSKQEDFSFARFCYSAALVSKNEKLKELKNMAKDEKSALMPASDAQKGYLVSLGVEFKDDITKGDADRMIKERVAKRNEYFEKANSPATEGQKKTLIANGKNFDENITLGEASKIIGKLHATVEQMDFMDKLKVQYGQDVTRDEASKLIEQKLRASEARDNEPATDKQRATLIAHGQEVTDDMTRREASAAIYFSPATEAQLNYLVDHEIKFDPEKICYGSAGRIIEERENKRFESRARPATENQLKYLSDNEIPHDKSITLGQAYDLIKHHKAEVNEVTPAQLKKAEELGIEVPDTMKRTELTEKISVTTKENAIKEYDAGDNSKTDVVSKYMELAHKQFAKTGDFSKFDDKKIAAELLKQGIDKDKVRSAVMLHSPVNRKFEQANELVNAAAKQPSVQKAMAAKAKEAEMGR